MTSIIVVACCYWAIYLHKFFVIHHCWCCYAVLHTDWRFGGFKCFWWVSFDFCYVAEYYCCL